MLFQREMRLRIDAEMLPQSPVEDEGDSGLDEVIEALLDSPPKKNISEGSGKHQQGTKAAEGDI